MLSDYPVIWLVVLFCINFLGNGTIPLPISVYVIWLGQFDMALPVVIVGTLGTVLGWIFVGSRILQKMLQKNYEKASGAMSKEAYQAELTQKIPPLYRALFLKRPLFAVFLFNAIPFPWDVMRILAVVSGINPSKLVMPLALGRIIRYSTLVSFGGVIAQYKGFLWVVIGLLILPVLLRVFKR